MNKITKTIIILLLSVSLSYSTVVAQALTRESHFSSYWDFYSYNRLSTRASGKGYTGIADMNDISGTILNPASLNIKRIFEVYFEYILKDIDSKRYNELRQIHPTFLVGVGYRVKNYFQTGILYYTNSNYCMDYGIVIPPMTSTGQVVGTSQHEYLNFEVNSFSIPFKIDIKDIISLGINVNFLFYSLEDALSERVKETDFVKVVPKFGIIVFPTKDLSFGFTYLPETQEDIIKKFSDGYEEKFKPTIFPKRIGIGMKYRVDATPILLFLDYNYSNDSKDEILIDRNDINFGLEYEKTKERVYRIGFFSQKDYRDKNFPASINTLLREVRYDQVFITFGTSQKILFFNLNLSIMNSSFLNTHDVKQTYLNVGINYDF